MAALSQDVWDWAGDQWDNITGETAADAAQDAAQLQYQASQDAIGFQEDAFAQMQENLEPYMQFGQEVMPQAQQAIQQSGQLYGEGASDAVMNNPMFQALLDQANTEILANQAARGRVGTGETPMFMQDAALRTGFDVLNTERAAANQRIGTLLSALGMGQNAAAGVGSAGMNTASQIGDLTTQGANALASGEIGAANAQAQGTGNLLGLGSAAFGAMGGLGGIGALFGGPSYAPTEVATLPGQSYGR